MPHGMRFFELIMIALGLGMDAMSVCMSVGVKWNGPRQKFRLAWHMGLFQFLMPIAGSLLGKELAGLLATYGKYIAAGLVFAVGAKMLYEALQSHPGAVAERAEHAHWHGHPAHESSGQDARATFNPKDPTRGWSLMVLSVATSLDALVVGFSLGLKGQTDLCGPSAFIGVVAAAMALTGVAVGQRAGQKFGKKAEIVGAVLLMLLGLIFVLPGL